MAGSTASDLANVPNSAFGVINPFEPVTDVSQLSLANGMTAGYGDNDGNTSNPPLPWASTSGYGLNPYGGNPGSWPVQRVGVMTNVVYGSGQAYFLYFLYNPNDIQVQFNMNASAMPPQVFYTANSTPVPNLVQSQSVSWTLFFDRTYDMLYDPRPDLNRGVLKDTAALYNLLGAFQGQSGAPSSPPLQVVFGQTTDGQLWGFTGFISSVNIDYGIFRHNMIPSNCQVQLTMTTNYVAPGTPSSSGSGVPASGGGPGSPIDTPTGTGTVAGGSGGAGSLGPPIDTPTGTGTVAGGPTGH